MLINLPKEFQRRCTAMFVPKKRAWTEGTLEYWPCLSICWIWVMTDVCVLMLYTSSWLNSWAAPAKVVSAGRPSQLARQNDDQGQY